MKRPAVVHYETLSRSDWVVQLEPGQRYERSGFVGGEHIDRYAFALPQPCHMLSVQGDESLQVAVAEDVAAPVGEKWRFLPLEAHVGLHRVEVMAHPSAHYTIVVRPGC